jgi:hypothetical protein
MGLIIIQFQIPTARQLLSFLFFFASCTGSLWGLVRHFFLAVGPSWWLKFLSQPKFFPRHLLFKCAQYSFSKAVAILLRKKAFVLAVGAEVQGYTTSAAAGTGVCHST